MITHIQFDNATKIIKEYTSQLERVIFERKSAVFVDIQNNISINVFCSLQYYFLDTFNKKLEYEDLKAIELQILKEINFAQMRKYRGFGTK